MVKQIISVLAVLLLLSGCEEGSDSSGTTDSSVQEVCGTEETFSNPASFCQIQQGLLIPKCVRCHEGGRFSIGEDANYDDLMDNGGWVDPGDPDNSEMFVRMALGQITDTVITEDELDAVESWILNGAQND